MKYAILVGEKLIYAKDYYFCNNGELITNFNKDIEAMTQQGFKVVVDEKPEYDELIALMDARELVTEEEK